MKKALLYFLLVIGISNPLLSQRLWYKTPANASVPDNGKAWKDDPEWLKALPLGNGNIGAMVFGDVNLERIQLNEKTLWSGGPADNDNPAAPKHLEEIRRLLFAGKFKEATELTDNTQVCKGKGSGFGNGADVPFGCYQTLGDLWLDFGKTSPYTNYERELDLNTAIAKVQYEQDGIKFRREYFVSYPANVLAIRLSADKKGAIDFLVKLSRPEKFITKQIDSNALLMFGSLNNGLGGNGISYASIVSVKSFGGKIGIINNSLKVSNVDEAVIILAAATDYKPVYPDYKNNDYKRKLSEASVSAQEYKSYEELRAEHIEDYQTLFNKVNFILSNEPDTIPTDERLKRIKETGSDNFLTQLYFQYGRYLLIASSRERTLPANLQGIWANKIQTPWNSDYHTNINVQMNYWPAEVTNLSSLHLPLADFIQSINPPARRTAKVQFGTDGWCISPIVNVWGFTAPGEHPSWGLTPGATGWLCQHLWEHYAFTNDKEYLRKIFPLLKGASQFYIDWLVKDKATGKLVSGPSSSPENSFTAPDGSVGTISMGPSHDQEIIDELFGNTIAAAKILNDNSPIVAKLVNAKAKLLQPSIGKDGRVLEWAKPYPEREMGHRHISHLYALYPGNAFFGKGKDAYLPAAKKSLETRLRNGGGHTGWSAAWVTNLWARLHQGDSALKAFNTILIKKSADNLFDLHPPFQIDGNFGATAGIAEMLLQSHTGVIEFLPALPTEWKNGNVHGLRARGGVEATSIIWKNGELQEAKVTANTDGKYTFRYKQKIVEVELKKNICTEIKF